jgi:glycerol-3-phosphate dehydrogenase (NAD(P)+)
MSGRIQRLAIVGAGAWGTALAMAATRAGSEVRLWAREPEVADSINESHENAVFLPGARLPETIVASTDMGETLQAANAVLLVAPAQHLRAVACELAPHVPVDLPLVICAKGIEQRTAALMSEVTAAALPGRPLCVLSGPTFAREVAEERPTAVTLAAEDPTVGEVIIAALGSRRFRPYIGDDLIGAQIGGAVKNVVAIACGIVAGRGLGANARAALITRGLAEIARLATAKGAYAETLMGLSGLGDLTLTATDTQSRNYSLGEAVGQGRTLQEILGERRSVAEGVHTAEAVLILAERLGVDMPITMAVDGVLNRGLDVNEIIESLLARPFKAERR